VSLHSLCITRADDAQRNSTKGPVSQPRSSFERSQLTIVAEVEKIQDDILEDPWVIDTCCTEVSLDKNDTACHCLATPSQQSSTIKSIAHRTQDALNFVRNRVNRRGASAKEANTSVAGTLGSAATKKERRDHSGCEEL
jgi:hypothetical protein